MELSRLRQAGMDACVHGVVISSACLGGRTAEDQHYRKGRPCLDLALGDVAMMVLWLGIDAAQGRVHHQLMPA